MLTINSKAVDFALPDQSGKIRKLSDYSGRWVVLYFYPKDNTPGCTKEACNFRDSYHTLEKMGVTIIGVSKDSVDSHKKFADKYNLNFPLLSDPDKKIIQDYGAWQTKKFFGKEFAGVSRMTYLIDLSGKIKKIYEKVNPLVHAGEIIEDVQILMKKEKVE